MKFKAGDKVRVKSWEEIEKTLDDSDECNEVYFSEEMKEFCGSILIIGLWNDDDVYEDTKSGWVWSEQWLEPVKNDFVVTVQGISPEELKKTFGERIKGLKIISRPRSVTEIYEELFLSTKDCHIEFAYKGWTTLAIVWKYDGTVETGYARRKPSDTSNRKAGQSLALARALGRKDIEEELLAFM